MQVLVTGAAGFIGSVLVDRLLAEGHSVAGVDSFDAFYAAATKRANLAQALRQPGFSLVELDIRDAEGLGELVERFQPDAIVHLAARAGVRPSLADPPLYADVNLTGTTNLLQAAIGLERRPRFVFASSSSVYGARSAVPFHEDDPVDRPVSPYAATKKACELMAHAFHHIHGLDVTGLRFFTAYGPRNRPDLAIYQFSARIEAGQPIPMFGDGSTERDYTYVDDIVDGVVRAVERCSGYRIYNLGNCHPVRLDALIAALGRALGKEPLIERQPEQPGDVPRTCADIGRAQAELGYQPRVSLEDGLARFVAWFRGL
jgi:UDP-glucuronate 4-epimerase